ncbi:solute carrier family 38 [Capsaspora owczarzaki ATCC 30864]|uniref:solute carrier family 38 n=1 Tax=Capsaspora owczarzaki (strain ATCC 30864) TaxID=595528 RepID=UPI0003522383|nr:solute carrier family 38 [Capsaspora owczarzaki ATCC 30864]|eukprot:XP_004345157.2 solute carrier family 38 [Capsaspora owczarzaki ATCC 30864]
MPDDRSPLLPSSSEHPSAASSSSSASSTGSSSRRGQQKQQKQQKQQQQSRRRLQPQPREASDAQNSDDDDDEDAAEPTDGLLVNNPYYSIQGASQPSEVVSSSTVSSSSRAGLMHGDRDQQQQRTASSAASSGATTTTTTTSTTTAAAAASSSSLQVGDETRSAAAAAALSRHSPTPQTTGSLLGPHSAGAGPHYGATGTTTSNAATGSSSSALAGKSKHGHSRHPSTSSDTSAGLPRVASAHSLTGTGRDHSPSNAALSTSSSDPHLLSTHSITSKSGERRPLNYTPTSSPTPASAMYSRYKYYNKLAPAEVETLRIPNHVLPPNLFILSAIGGKASKPSQSSLVTILSIWNTMIGTSMLSMPWAIQQAGFSLAIITMIAMALITLYTCTLVVRHGNGGFGPKGEEVELPEVAQQFLGRKGFYVAITFALVTYVGAQIVYWVLMSGFLFATVDYIHDHGNSNSSSTSSDTFSEYWNNTYAPLYLVVLLFPLCSFKSLTFFTKFNSFGVVSIAYIIFFVLYKGAESGVHFDHVKEFDGHFISLAGVLTLSFFMHNGSLSIVRNNRNPANNVRDLSIAYGLVAMTYAVVGFIFFITFDGDKDKITSNLLENFQKSDVMALVARCFLLFQMITVFPLLMYIVRFQFMNSFFGSPYPSFFKVTVLNAVITAACVTMAIVYPNIGDIIRFTGAFSGLALVFALPCLIHLEALRRANKLTRTQLVLHWGLIVLGAGNLIGQFAVL